MFDFGVNKYFDKKSINSWFALPDSGGAFMCILMNVFETPFISTSKASDILFCFDEGFAKTFIVRDCIFEL